MSTPLELPRLLAEAAAAPLRPQVAREHYDFSTYATRARWSSYWHQLRDVLAVRPESCAVVGKGDDIVPRVLEGFGVAVTTIDFDPALTPDCLADVRSIPLPDSAYDVVLASQVLEHLPLADLGRALSELARIATTRLVVSVPQRGRAWELSLKLPILPSLRAGGVLPARTHHSFDGHHYWELGARGFRRRMFEAVLREHVRSFTTYVVPDNPYHRFYVAVP